MTNRDPLDDLFAQARNAPPAASDAFLNDMRRLAVDHTPHVTPPPKGSSLWSMIGGWRLGLGMAMALGCGVMVGAYPPDTLATFVFEASFTTDDVMVLSGYADDGLATLEGGL